jgi:hypothetical protein
MRRQTIEDFYRRLAGDPIDKTKNNPIRPVAGDFDKFELNTSNYMDLLQPVIDDYKEKDSRKYEDMEEQLKSVTDINGTPIDQLHPYDLNSSSFSQEAFLLFNSIFNISAFDSDLSLEENLEALKFDEMEDVPDKHYHDGYREEHKNYNHIIEFTQMDADTWVELSVYQDKNTGEIFYYEEGDLRRADPPMTLDKLISLLNDMASLSPPDKQLDPDAPSAASEVQRWMSNMNFTAELN